MRHRFHRWLRLGHARPRGQTLSESVMLLPFLLVLGFGLLQVGHLGLGVAVVNYAAGSIARYMVQLNQDQVDQSAAQQKLDSLMTAGLKSAGVFVTEDKSGVTRDVRVTACAELQAYPGIGAFLNKALTGGNNHNSGSSSCESEDGFGFIGLEGPPPYKFIIRGKGAARMNYSLGG